VAATFQGVSARQSASHDDMAAETLGKVSFPISCSSEVQQEFETGVAALHSFEYESAIRHFQDVLQRDPNCAMAYWGEAMSLYHQLWNPPSEKDLSEGWQYIGKAGSATNLSSRERGFLRALRIFYKPGNQSAYDRAKAYSQAMRELHHQYPSDEEATIFYALSLLAAAPPGDTSLESSRKAVTLLNGVLLADPEHPGVAHYLIHACDNPTMAKDGLEAAKRYARIAPSSPHALHMPSHIFARLGLWQDDISSNLAAVSAARKNQSAAEQRLHPMDFLEYAYLQTGQIDQAREIEAAAVGTENRGFTRGLESYFFYAQAHFPALLALETRDWNMAKSLQPVPGAKPGTQAITFWVQAIGASRAGDMSRARAAVQHLDEALAADEKQHPGMPRPPVDARRNEAHAWLAFAEKNNAEAFRLLKAIIGYQDRVGKGEVELPAREMYADMLLELNRPSEALEQYRLSLKSDPNRFHGLYGAAHSAELADQPAVAAKYYKQLLDNCARASNPPRPELQHAKRFVTQTAHEEGSRFEPLNASLRCASFASNFCSRP